MPTRKSPRKGSLQFWPRKRARKILHRVNWDAISNGKNLKGFICYKAGMASVLIRDNTPNSMNKGKDIPIACTILECPRMRVLSIRFYKGGKVIGEVIQKNIDKRLKSKIKIPKKETKKIEDFSPEDYDDVRVIVYSEVKKTGIKKTPDISEIGLNGTKEEKLEFIKNSLENGFRIFDVFEVGELVDIRGVTKGKGFQGPVKRFGISLKQHKSEKGRRTPGSIGPWHPAYVTFRAPMAGQTGFFTRTHYNQKIVFIGKEEESEKIENIKNYGNIKTDYIIITGSVQGPAKRQVIITHALRPSKDQLKKEYEFRRIIK